MPVSNAKQHEAEGLPYPSSSSQAEAAASPRPTSARARLGRLALAAAAGWLLVHSTPVGKSVLNRFNSGASAWPDDLSESPPPSLTAVEVEMLAKSSCPAQVEPLNVGPDWAIHTDRAYAHKAADRLARAIQIETVSFDDMTTGPVDGRFDGLRRFGTFLDKEFPRVREKLSLELVNDLGRLYTWPGSSPELKPLLLMAHQDTVPVPNFTVDRWTYPPFSGHVDDEGWLWGRGSADCKNTLMGILGAVEKLVEQGFEPERTILLAFGYDEEIGGPRGAAGLAERIYDRYGQDGIALIVDEGFTGVDEAFGVELASLGIAEKGAVNLQLEVATLGGHSSVPPKHTSIGLLSLLIAELERKPFTPQLAPESPYLRYLQCGAEFGPSMPAHLRRRLLQEPKSWPALALELAEEDRIVAAFLATTQSVDLIEGGVKVNAIPERAKATVNYRIDFLSSVNETVEHVVTVLKPLVRSLNLTLELVGDGDDGNPGNTTASSAVVDVVRLTVGSPSEMGLEPAPLTPTRGKAFELVAGTTRHVFPEAIVAPSAMIANTDTKHFWNTTANIFRFLPAPLAQVKNFHTVDERIKLEGHLTVTAWYHKLMLNTQGWSG